LDYLEVNNFSNDGGTTFISGTLIAVPDCESVEILFTPNPSDNKPALQESFTFPVNELVGRCDVLVYKDPSVLYNVKYRYKNIKEYTQYKAISTDIAIGYLTEASFDDNGNLKSSDQRVYYPYTTNDTNGFIQLQISVNAISKFRKKIDKGDVIGVTKITTFDSATTIDLIVGVSKNYIYVSGDLTLDNDIYFALDKGVAVEGNEFRIHIDCNSLDLQGHSIFIVQDFGTVSQTVLKQITQGDVYQMLNQDGGIAFDAKYNGSDWVAYQNYDLGQPFEIKLFDNDIAVYFDETFNGKVKGYFGWKIHQVLSGRVPVGYGEVTDTAGNVQNFTLGATGGEVKHQLTVNELPKFTPKFGIATDTDLETGGSTTYFPIKGNPDISGLDTTAGAKEIGDDVAHNNLQPYYVVAYIKKQY
jgi:hypothetical protein